MFLNDLIRDLDIVKKKGDIEEISGITDDSRNVKPGFMFAAIKGEKFDGHLFYREAINKGAAILLLEREVDGNFPYIIVPNSRQAFSQIACNYYGNPSRDIKVIGITGTNGKTTTALLLSSIYKNSVVFNTIKYLTTEGEIKAINTTPSTLFINRELRKAVDNGINTAIMEVSSHGIQQERIYGIEFDYGIFTNISRDHLDYHKTFEAYRETKLRLFRDFLDEDDIAIINADDNNARYFIKKTKARVVTFGLHKGNIIGRLKSSTFEGLTIEVEGFKKNLTFDSSIIGKHNVYNILASVTLSIVDGIDEERIVEGIRNTSSPCGRMERIYVPKPISVFIDYAHTPEALNYVLSSIRELKPERIITVFGAGGDRDKGKRSMMGLITSNLSDVVIVTSDNPRTENPEEIIDDIIEGVKNGSIYRIVDRKEAINKALELAEKGDIVLIAGKGHEEYQEINNRRVEFSDKKCVKEYFNL